MKNYRYSSIEESKQDEFPEAPLLRMFVLGLILVSPSFLYGLIVSYPAIALSEMELNLNDASWFGSMALFVAPFSSIIVGIIIDLYGRKMAILYSIFPSIAGWSLQYYSSNIVVSLCGQILNGLTLGAVSYPIQVYAGECVMIHHVRLRNSFMIWIAVGCSLATTFMLTIANFFTYRQICGYCTIFTIILAAVFLIIIPESPTWLYHRGRIDDAKRSQRKLGIAQPILSRDSLSNIVATPPHDLTWSSLSEKFKKIKRRDIYLPSILLSISALLINFCGGVTIVTYTINIINDSIPGTPITYGIREENRTFTVHFSKSTEYSILSGISMCIGSLLSSFVIPYLGVNAALMFANVCNIIGLMSLTYSSTIIESSQTAFIIRVVSVSLISFVMSITLGPTLAISGDIFPIDGKGFACIPDVVGYLAAGLANKLFPYFYYLMTGYSYLVFVTGNIIMFLYVYFFFPDVVGKTLKEINDQFLDKKALGQTKQKEYLVSN